MNKEETTKQAFTVEFKADKDLEKDAEKLGVAVREFLKICIVLGTVFAEYHEKGGKLFIHEADGGTIELVWRNPE